MKPIDKFKGQKAQIPPRPSVRHLIIAGIGSFLCITLLTLADDPQTSLFILSSFGASSILIFGYPEAPFSQPRHIIFGHLLSVVIALSLFDLLGYYWWSLALAVSMSIITMMICRIMHPPAGSNPMIIYFTVPNWDFLLFPLLSGTLILVSFALIYNNLVHKKKYPLYW